MVIYLTTTAKPVPEVRDRSATLQCHQCEKSLEWAMMFYSCSARKMQDTNGNACNASSLRDIFRRSHCLSSSAMRHYHYSFYIMMIQPRIMMSEKRLQSN